MRRAAWLDLGGNAAPIPCVVWDLSEGGCRLAAPHAIKLPEVFALTMNAKADVRHSCCVVWQRGVYVGVKFIDADEAERIAESNASRPAYLNNDLASFSPAKKKAVEKTKPGAFTAGRFRKMSRLDKELF